MSSFTERLGNLPESEPLPASPAEIRAQLHRILGLPVFLDARRPSAFLSFIVETSLTGGAAGIKEYLIGVEVFDRSSEYDPKDDPIVRIEAGRLRKKLTEYYAGPGARDPILIEVPKGGYVPVFQRRAGTAEPEETQPPRCPMSGRLRKKRPFHGIGNAGRSSLPHACCWPF